MRHTTYSLNELIVHTANIKQNLRIADTRARAGKKDKENRNCSSVPAVVLAANPNLKRSYEIEKAKNRCIRERICRPDDLIGSLPCEFTAYDLKECKDIDPALSDYKTARRHLEAQVETCELRKMKSRYGTTVYQWTDES